MPDQLWSSSKTARAPRGLQKPLTSSHVPGAKAAHLASPLSWGQPPIHTGAQAGSGADALTTHVLADGWQGREGENPNPVPSLPCRCQTLGLCWSHQKRCSLG